MSMLYGNRHHQDDVYQLNRKAYSTYHDERKLRIHVEETNELTHIVFKCGGIQVRDKLANGFLCSILETGTRRKLVYQKLIPENLRNIS
jgi:hypothetical protein